MRRRLMSNNTKIYEDTIVQFKNDKNNKYATVEIKGDYPEGATFELTRCGRNLFETKKDNFINPNLEKIEGDKIIINSNSTYIQFFSKTQPYPLDKIYTHSIITDIDILIKIGNTSKSQLSQIKELETNKKYVTSIGLNSRDSFCFSRDSINNYDNELIVGVVKIQDELGSIVHPYEPYTGETFTIAPNTPTKIQLLDGVNTLFTNSYAMLKITLND